LRWRPEGNKGWEKADVSHPEPCGGVGRMCWGGSRGLCQLAIVLIGWSIGLTKMTAKKVAVGSREGMGGVKGCGSVGCSN